MQQKVLIDAAQNCIEHNITMTMEMTMMKLYLNGITHFNCRVLRPPGGGSSDIFGTDTPSTPRSVRNHMASNIFGSTQDASVKNSVDSARRGQKNTDSYNRLFGEPERPFTPAKNHMRSNIPIGSEGEKLKSRSGPVSNASTTNGHGDKNGKAENGGTSANHIAVEQNGVSKTDGNPVTGEGYKPAGAEINTTIPCLNGANQVINKNRIPPGGYSSGLW